MKVFVVRALLTGMAIVISGCASNTEIMSKRMVMPPHAAAMELESNQEFLMAVPISNPMPQFPSTGSAARASEVCVEIVVTGDGEVEDAIVVGGVDTCDVEPPADFAEASLVAVRDWSFFGAAVCEFPSVASKNQDCSGSDVIVRPVSIKLMYAFKFEVSNGRGKVSAERRSGGR